MLYWLTSIVINVLLNNVVIDAIDTKNTYIKSACIDSIDAIKCSRIYLQSFQI